MKRKDSLKTLVVDLKSCILCWSLANGSKQLRSFLKNVICTKVKRLLGGDFYASLNKIEIDILLVRFSPQMSVLQ